jgi:hypothetical protein
MTEATTTTLTQSDCSPAEFQMKLAEWREKARNNQLTVDEMREAILFLREGRVHAAAAKAAKTKASSSPRTLKEKAAAVDSDALLGDLGI